MVPYPVGGRHLDSRRRARPPSLDLPTLLPGALHTASADKWRMPGGLAQLARAPALQAGGQRFESVILHQKHIDMLEAENRTERPPWTPARGSPAGQEDKLM